jgi:hypothetical protein
MAAMALAASHMLAYRRLSYRRATAPKHGSTQSRRSVLGRIMTFTTNARSHLHKSASSMMVFIRQGPPQATEFFDRYLPFFMEGLAMIMRLP